MDIKISKPPFSIYMSLIAMGAGLFFSSVATAGTAEEPASLLGPRSVGRAGSTVASSIDHDALLQNPASAAAEARYAVTAGFLGLGNSLTASIVDTKSGPIGGGIYYVRRDLQTGFGDSPNIGNYPRTEERAGAAFFGKLNDQFGVGITATYFYQKAYDTQSSSLKEFNFNFGARYAVSQVFSLGVLGQNLLSDANGVNVRTFTGGAEFMPMANLILSLQVAKISEPGTDAPLHLPKTGKTISWAGGVQYTYSGASVRAGYASSPSWDLNSICLGLAYATKNFSVDYSFQHGISTGKSINAHSVSISAFL